MPRLIAQRNCCPVVHQAVLTSRLVMALYQQGHLMQVHLAAQSITVTAPADNATLLTVSFLMDDFFARAALMR